MASDGSLDSHRRSSASVRDIRKPPDVGWDHRREPADKSLRVFLESYFPQAFPLAWSDDHLRAIDILQRVSDDGGLFALAMPRGSGKTSLTIRAAIWALLTARRRYVEVICSTETAAKKIIKAIRSELSFNQNLRADYIKELHGIWQLQGDNRRSAGQLCNGEKTGVVLGTSEIVFPTHEYSPIGGSIVYAAGLTGSVRGPNHTLMDGSVLRPDMVILDDPQTRESAKSRAQTEDRIEIVEGDVLGLAGPGKTIAAVMPCTVIAKDDLAETFLSHRQWSSIRCKLLYSFPSDMTWWDRYFAMRDESLRVDGNTTASDELIKAEWDEAHAGAKAGWEERKNADEFSAVQSAMHLWHRSPTAFAAEYQNEPIDASISVDAPTFESLSSRFTGLDRLIVPIWASRVTVGIDIQQRIMFYVMTAWADDFTGTIIDYGCCPRQSRLYFDATEANPSLQVESGSDQLEGAVYWGLDTLTRELSVPIRREGGGEMSVSRMLIDANWGPSTDTVYEFCRRTPLASIISPAHGRGVKAGDKPMTMWPKRSNESIGFHWIHTTGSKARAVRHVMFDANFWKSFMSQRVMSRQGEKGSFSIYGTKPEQHRLMFDHLTSEAPTKTFGREREVWEWKLKPGRENHWLDCLSMSGVAASMLGCNLSHLGPALAPQAKPVRLSDLQAAKRRHR